MDLCEIALRCMSLDLINYKSTFVQVMVWCSRATSHNMNQFEPFMWRHIAPLRHKELTRPTQNDRHFCRGHFKMRCVEICISYFVLFFGGFFGSGNGLVLIMRKVTWNNDDQGLWCYMASLTRLQWMNRLVHDDVIKWKHFPRYWPFVWGIHRWPVNSPHKGQWRRALMFSWSAPERPIE